MAHRLLHDFVGDLKEAIELGEPIVERSKVPGSTTAKRRGTAEAAGRPAGGVY